MKGCVNISMMTVKYYKCPSCNKKFKTLNGWGDHIDKMHPGLRPEGYSVARYFYFTMTGKTHGICRTCKGPTPWNENSWKYDQYCTNPECKKAYVKLAKSRMVGKYGKEHLLDDPNIQKKMVSNRKISGKYTFDDGTKFEYVGQYERNFLEMLNTMMEWDSNDLISPSPHIYYYDYENPKDDKKNWGRKFYIPDFYIPSLNLEIEIKQQTSTNKAFNDINRVKEKLKDEVMASNKNVRYLKINDNNFTEFFEFLMKAKEEIPEEKDENSRETLAVASESCKNVNEARKFLQDVDKIGKKYNANFFIVTDGASMTRNGIYGDKKSNPVVSNAREAQKKWELENSADPDEDWVKDKATESYVFDEEDFYYNKDKFDSGETNICFITGYSGSGKSTMGKDMSDVAEHYDVDLLIYQDEYSEEYYKTYGGPYKKWDLFHKFLFKDKIGKKFRVPLGEICGNPDLKDFDKKITLAFTNFVLRFAETHKDRKFVLEGIWFYEFISPELLQDYAVYIKGTSGIKSLLRATKRDIPEYKGIKDGIDSFTWNLKRMKEVEEKLQMYRKYFKVKMLTNASESSTSKEDDVITVINKYFSDHNYKSGIKPNGDWGLKKFNSGESNSLFIISHSEYKKIAKDLKEIIDSSKYKIGIDNYNTLFLKRK